MSFLQIIGREAEKLLKLESGFWDAINNPQFQGCWNTYRRDFLAAVAQSVSQLIPRDAGRERTFRILDRLFLARSSLALALVSEKQVPTPVGVVEFFHAPKEDDKPFYRLFFDSEARFGTTPFELNVATLSSADLLLGLFEAMAEKAVSLYFVLPDRPTS
jgi:hypothetical protein